MLDPKSLEALVAIGGIEGLLRGLETNAERRFSTEDASTRVHEKQETSPEVVLTEPSGNVGTPTDDRSAFTASFDDRKCVYGKDILPTRISKTLMWATIKDEVLVHLPLTV
jgi:Ca2+-transporting ATPase